MNASPGKAAFDNFQNSLVASKEEIADLLPSTITWDRMRNTVIAAVKSNPDLLLVEQRFLKRSIVQAATDALMPDGKEGVIIVQNEKLKGSDGKDLLKDGKPQWIKTCRWQPMLYGIRKRARELDGLILDAKVVFKNDSFEWEEGDEPFIHHKPVALDGDTGPLVGCYAHFRKGNDILHREVMRKVQVMAVKAISKQPNGLMWTSFEEEAWKKSAVRRGIKTVPCTPQLETVIRRFDELHDVTPDRTNPLDEDAEPMALPPPDAKPQAIRGTGPVKAPPPPSVQTKAPAPPAEAASDSEGADASADSKTEFLTELAGCMSEVAVISLQNKSLLKIVEFSSDDREEVIAAIEEKRQQLRKP